MNNEEKLALHTTARMLTKYRRESEKMRELLERILEATNRGERWGDIIQIEHALKRIELPPSVGQMEASPQTARDLA